MAKSSNKTQLSSWEIDLSPAEIMRDYRLAFVSREASLLGRKEVLSGKAKFGIFGDGKELAQIAMSRVFAPGDWRSGYYRDQTFMLAVEALTIKQFLAQLYADTDISREPNSGGRQMNSHFATRLLNEDGSWRNQMTTYNTSADASPTACQMARLLGLAYASKLYRHLPHLDPAGHFTQGGSEVAFGTIGNASTSEGIFWETLNAAGVLDVPMVVSVWDDDYGISVPNKYQTTKESISKICAGFAREPGTNGYNIYVARGWDYPELLRVYREAVKEAREKHIPALVHVVEMSQPQGHSTSGSQERYKSKDRLAYETSIDCLVRMREWMIQLGICAGKDLDQTEENARAEVQRLRGEAWDEYLSPMRSERDELLNIFKNLATTLGNPLPPPVQSLKDSLQRSSSVSRKTNVSYARRAAYYLRDEDDAGKQPLFAYIEKMRGETLQRYSSKLMPEGPRSALNLSGISPEYDEGSEKVDGRVVIQRCFDRHLARDPRLFIIGEDVGKLGGVNLEFDGLSDKYGELRVCDTGIREATILGQGIGAALRGLRPIVDIQYLDYLLYAFELLSDDLASLHYRTAGGQTAPVIVRSKGHRLEGVWHSGSPMGMIINGIRGMHVCVPRNMVQAAGLYNTLLASDDPALVIEVLNSYRVKEDIPTNLGSFRIPLGVPEILKSGLDITVVTYGACVSIVREAQALLEQFGIDIELIDVQTLLPFDRPGVIAHSIKKTNAVLFLDEDVPGGATAYMMREVLEIQGAYEFLDAPPRTLTAKEHRSPYASDGDYFTKPSIEDVVEVLYAIMRERQPERFPDLGM